MHSDEQLGGKEGSSTGDELGALIQSATSAFAIPPDGEQLFAPLTEAIPKISQPFNEIGKVLRANIDGLISAVSIPYTLASRSAHDRHWQRIYLAERIRARKLDAGPDESSEALELRRDREALVQAKPKM